MDINSLHPYETGSSITIPEVFEGLEFELPMLDAMYDSICSMSHLVIFSDLPEMEDGLITFNIAHVKDITFANEIDIMRHTQAESGSLDLFSQADKFVADQVTSFPLDHPTDII
jgi:hypothetical protein